MGDPRRFNSAVIEEKAALAGLHGKNFQLAPHPSTIGLMTDFDGKFKCWHEMWSCGDIVVCQVTRQFQNGAEAKAWGVRHVNHNGERKPDEKIFPPNMMVNTVYQCRPSPLSERLWSVGQNFHLFRNRELDNCTDTPLQAIILKAIAKDKAPLSLNTFNAFFVKNNCVHKVYIQGSGNINGDLLVIFSQLLCEFLAQEEVKTYKAHVVHRIMLHDNIRRKYEQMLNKIGSLSLELEEQGKKELALNSVLSNDLQTLQSIASMFQNQLFDPTVVLMPANAEGVLGKMLKWPTDQVFPAIDLATLLALTRDGARLLTVRLRAVPVMIDILNRDMKSARNVSLVLKFFTNCFRWTDLSTPVVVNANQICMSFGIIFQTHGQDATVLKNLSILLVNYMNFLCRSSSENVYRVATFKVAISMLLAQINDDITILCLYCVSIFVLEEDNKPYRLDPAV